MVLSSTKSVIDYDISKVTLHHGSDKLIFNFKDKFENNDKIIEGCESQQDLFINFANEPPINSLKITVATC